jgi:hypothetical protein
MYETLQADNVMQVPFTPKRGPGANLRRQAGSEAADFPDHVLREKSGRE